MSRFIDEYLPDCVAGYPCISAPRFSTQIVVVDSGAEQANSRWNEPLRRFQLPEAVRTMEVYNALRDHWLIMRGPFHTFPWRDPLDYASVNITQPASLVPPTTSPTDQELGLGDGLRNNFKLIKTYRRGQYTYERKITLPVTNTITVAVGGVDLGNYNVTREGVVEFATPPAIGAVLTWGGLFDCCVRFESDDTLEGVVRSFGLGGYADITLLETLRC